MSYIYVVYANQAPQAVWLGTTQHRTPPVDPAITVVEVWQLPTRDMADYVKRLAERQLARSGVWRDPDGWYAAEPETVCETIDYVHHITVDRSPIGTMAPVMIALRKRVFDCSQATLAHLADVSRSMVCRWEQGATVPDLAAIARLREHAFLAGLPWPNGFPLAVSDPRTLRVVDGEYDADPGRQGNP